MSTPVHRIPISTLDALGRGGGSIDAITRLRDAELSRVRLLVYDIVMRVSQVAHPQARATLEAFRLLRVVERHAPEVVVALLSYPPVTAWAAQTVRLLNGDRYGEANPGFLAALAAATALRAGQDIDLEVPAHPDGGGTLVLPTIGSIPVPVGEPVRVRISSGVATIHCRNRTIGTVGDATSGWHAAPTLEIDDVRTGLTLHLDVATWRAAMGAAFCVRHRIDDTDIDLSRWHRQLVRAWSLLTRHHRAPAVELAVALTVLVPLARVGNGHVSSTFNATFGAVAMTEPTGPRTTALALVHETQHAKFGALRRLLPLMVPDDGARYYAPWRNDPRPLPALLDGAYAFLGVAGFWRRQRVVESDAVAQRRADIEFNRWTGATLRVARLLVGHPSLTDTGRFLVERMRDTLADWESEPVPQEAAAAARLMVEKHLADWTRRNPGPANASPHSGSGPLR